MFLNLGEIGCFPGLRLLKSEMDGGGCLEEASNLAKLHNKALNSLLPRLEKQLHGFKYFLYDFKTSLAQKITQPLKYGNQHARTLPRSYNETRHEIETRYKILLQG